MGTRPPLHQLMAITGGNAMHDILTHGDCLDVLCSMPDNSVDSIVTDPPYGIKFMGKTWDYDVPSPGGAESTPTTSWQASGPNEVRTWDITWVPSTIKRDWFYLYQVEDLYSRKIMGYEVHETECGEQAAALIQRTALGKSAGNARRYYMRTMAQR
ncbi:hypothetical protein [Yersinia proxima]|nr:hypothetical protein [Yersinia proxima]